MYTFTRLLYSRDITQSQQILMEELIAACQKLFKRAPLPLWDQLYMLKVIKYGELQQKYKEKNERSDCWS
mgnify:CR=1 FL=1|jgi:hypothetical protein